MTEAVRAYPARVDAVGVARRPNGTLVVLLTLTCRCGSPTCRGEFDVSLPAPQAAWLAGELERVASEVEAMKGCN